MDSQFVDHYATLSLSPSCTGLQIFISYYKLHLRLEAEFIKTPRPYEKHVLKKSIRAVHEAFMTLIDSESREDYDEEYEKEMLRTRVEEWLREVKKYEKSCHQERRRIF